MKEHGICAKCKKSVGCPYADDRIKGCKKFVLDDELELTEQEYLQTCNTEQLAEWIADKSNEIISWIICEVIKNECDVDEEDYWQKKSDVLEWLKQPHKE